ncbi:hypothetical protein J1TS3_03120 [Siminovitchia fordii]|uniref:Uncharacterized protein n=1 Tax=Siminovitchia fordii TaxID=254759 RepID=A0ABQ4K085_9BACI|nr:hypothetical protein J1TS3_03120 [Siminovitchia fordii]
MLALNMLKSEFSMTYIKKIIHMPIKTISVIYENSNKESYFLTKKTGGESKVP